MDELVALTEHHQEFCECSMMLFTETWLTKVTLDTHVSLDGFKFLRVDRRRNTRQPVDPSTILMFSTTNIIAKLLLGTRYSYSDKTWRKILQDIHDSFHIISSIWGQMYDIFPGIMRYLPGPHQKIFTLLQPLEDAVEESVKNHQKTLDPACPRDYIDCFLLRMKQEEKNGETVFNVRNLVSTIFGMFLGGSESTSITINYGLLMLVKYPEIQDKVREEIDQVIGRVKEPKADDRNHMPYTNALLHEIQRYCDIFPIAFMRATARDVIFHGHYIPKGTDVLTLLTSVLQDPSQYEKPEEFNIYRFLDENGKFKKHNAFMPFAAGKRACVAESLVRLELFFFFTIILQNFTLKSSVDPKDLDISPAESGIENLPPAHEIQFIPRT
ncbi:cytochrome P450 2C42-like [Leptodactylus fuscus]|uniref:cytochrome P450 2C42-like n=1 Tax=Leptodactylus fuscus TaxID=238119 RepID=UPI003F4EFD0F